METHLHIDYGVPGDEYYKVPDNYGALYEDCMEYGVMAGWCYVITGKKGSGFRP